VRETTERGEGGRERRREGGERERA